MVPVALEILCSIVKTCRGLASFDSAPQELSVALRAELDVEVTAEEIISAGSLAQLADLVAARLPREPGGRSLIDIYAAVETIVREELSHDVNYHWHARWLGDLLHKTDSLEDVEIVIRMEEAFGISIPDRDAQKMHTVRQTVRYLWQRLCEQRSNSY
jgi:acyl carrier protein